MTRPVRATTLCLVSAAMRSQVPAVASYVSTPTVR